MPRQARLRLADIPFHVVQRGHNREPCFLTDVDRIRYLDELGQAARCHGVHVHAYVLMTNHVHLLATAREPDGIPDAMKRLGQRYVRYFNRRHARTGSLWEGRYYSSAVDTEGYLLTCHRYIEQNPVRARMVGWPGAYAWSSFGANALGQPNALVSPHPVVVGLGRTPEECRVAYRGLFDVGLDEASLQDIRVATRGGYAIGSERFKNELARTLRRRVSRIGSGRRKKENDCVPL